MRGHLRFGGYDFGEMFYCHAQKRVMPESEVQEVEVGGRHGAYFHSRRFLPAEIECVLVLRGAKQGHSRMLEILDEVAAHLREPQQRLYLPDDEERYLIATVAGMGTVEEFVSSARLTVTFRAPDPFKFGKERTVQVGESTVAVKTGGNVESKPVIRATASSGATYFQAWSPTADRFVRVFKNKVNMTEAFAGTEAIVIDMEAEKATVNGNLWPVSLDSDYWALDGDSTVRLTGGSGSMEWKERWL